MILSSDKGKGKTSGLRLKTCRNDGSVNKHELRQETHHLFKEITP